MDQWLMPQAVRFYSKWYITSSGVGALVRGIRSDLRICVSVSGLSMNILHVGDAKWFFQNKHGGFIACPKVSRWAV